jgi:hypothetical protein
LGLREKERKREKGGECFLPTRRDASRIDDARGRRESKQCNHGFGTFWSTFRSLKRSGACPMMCMRDLCSDRAREMLAEAKNGAADMRSFLLDRRWRPPSRSTTPLDLPRRRRAFLSFSTAMEAPVLAAAFSREESESKRRFQGGRAAKREGITDD